MNIKTFIAYIFVLLVVYCTIFISISLGLLIKKVFKLQFLSKHKYTYLMNSFWIGYTIFTSILIVVNVKYKISIYSIFPLIIILCGISFISNFKSIIYYIREVLTLKFFAIIFLVSFLAIFFLRSNFSGNYATDMYNYHFLMLRLANEYSAIPGLVNLYSYLGNIFSTTYVASFFSLFAVSPVLEAYLFFMTSALLIVALIFTIISMLYEMEMSVLFEDNQIYQKIFYVFLITSSTFFLLVPFSSSLINMGSEQLRNHIPEINSYILGYVLLIYFLKFILLSHTILVNSNSNFFIEEVEEQKSLFFILLSIAVSSVFLKLSSLIFVITIVVIAMIFYFKSFKKRNVRKVILFIVFYIVVFLPYIITSVIKSGSLLFPISFVSLNLAWSNPEELKVMTTNIRSWARHPADGYSDFASLLNIKWIPFWISMYWKYLLYYISLYVGSYILLKNNTIALNKNKLNKLIGIIIIPSIVSFLYWIIMAPDIRFAGIMFQLPIYISFSVYFAYKRFTLKVLLEIFFVGIVMRVVNVVNMDTIHFIVKHFAFWLIGIVALIYIGILLFKKKDKGIKDIVILSRLKTILNYLNNIKIRKNMIFLMLLLSLFLVSDKDAVRDIIQVRNNDKNLRKEEYMGIDVYFGGWSDEKYCAYTKNLPCTLGIDTDYTWVDDSYWEKGLIKKDP